MADYWKSNDRKYCDFCKCWITDNKPSVAFHENGKRHKANVAKRISDISRNSAKAEKDKFKMGLEIRKIEEAALRSYAHDVSSKADLTARSINVVIQANNSKHRVQIDPLLPPSDFDHTNAYSTTDIIAKIPEHELPTESMWVEAKSPEGLSYYWNVKTNESIWETPKEGYMPLEEYNTINQIAIAQQKLQIKKESKKLSENAAETMARYRREHLKIYRRPDLHEKIKDERRATYKTEEDVQGASPIGVWQTVVKREQVRINLELPKLETVTTIPSDVIADQLPLKRFKEKTINWLDTEANIPITFKKRKINKNNTRQRLQMD